MSKKEKVWSSPLYTPLSNVIGLYCIAIIANFYVLTAGSGNQTVSVIDLVQVEGLRFLT